MKVYCGNCKSYKEFKPVSSLPLTLFNPYQCKHRKLITRKDNFKEFWWINGDCSVINKNNDCQYYKPTLKQRIKELIRRFIR